MPDDKKVMSTYDKYKDFWKRRFKFELIAHAKDAWEVREFNSIKGANLDSKTQWHLVDSSKTFKTSAEAIVYIKDTIRNVGTDKLLQ